MVHRRSVAAAGRSAGRRTTITVGSLVGLVGLAAVGLGVSGHLAMAVGNGVAGGAGEFVGDGDATFAAPVRLTAGGRVVQVESPGYAAPAWHDVDGDGIADLVVGQFAKGRMRVYLGTGTPDGATGAPGLAAGDWLMAGDTIAEVPGVW